eukprot:TRINITY_DN7013_c0_g1_i1.p1 TRINITY_DN7013_c0_g1~~TRINITY_DN7013_c0_g1_i1.p1  ORF type:complete len:389 (-),score=96.63 TRINITY_DN7013_c0_g1_i1:57-1193(-)
MADSNLPQKSFWLISVPKKESGPDVFDELNRKVMSLDVAGEHYKFEIPDLRVGTLDSLMTLSDDLSKIDTFVESVVKKIGRQILDLLGKEKRSEARFDINDASMDSFVVRFKWEDARYPRRKSLNELTETIQSQVAKLDEELKAKSAEYNNVITAIQQRKKKEAGNLLARDVTNLVPPEAMIETDYLTTLLVVVPKTEVKSWYANYETLAPYVVPRSSQELHSDNEHALFKVTLFKKAAEEFKNNAREYKFTVRKYEPSEAMNPEEQKKLEQDQQRLKKTLSRWCNTNFAEAFIAWIHLKCIRCFVESVLRYGLPARFQAMLLVPKNNKENKLRDVLADVYSNLGRSFAAHDEDTNPGDRFYSYVSSDISLDLKYEKD